MSIMFKSPRQRRSVLERRGGFYETAGALRDMISKSRVQLTSLVRWNLRRRLMHRGEETKS